MGKGNGNEKSCFKKLPDITEQLDFFSTSMHFEFCSSAGMNSGWTGFVEEKNPTPPSSGLKFAKCFLVLGPFIGVQRCVGIFFGAMQVCFVLLDCFALFCPLLKICFMVENLEGPSFLPPPSSSTLPFVHIAKSFFS